MIRDTTDISGAVTGERVITKDPWGAQVWYLECLRGFPRQRVRNRLGAVLNSAPSMGGDPPATQRYQSANGDGCKDEMDVNECRAGVGAAEVAECVFWRPTDRPFNCRRRLSRVQAVGER